MLELCVIKLCQLEEELPAPRIISHVWTLQMMTLAGLLSRILIQVSGARQILRASHLATAVIDSSAL